MRKFLGGAMVAVAIIVAAVFIWYGLEDQAQGLVVGVLLGAAGIVVGVLLALAVVAIFLLLQLRWSVNQGAKPPIFLPGNQPALPTPSQQQWYPPRRSPREWDGVVLGRDDIEQSSRE